jgi:cell wall-associated NlpC family hydrolase
MSILRPRADTFRRAMRVRERVIGVRRAALPLSLVASLSAACASTGAVPRPFPAPGGRAVIPNPGSTPAPPDAAAIPYTGPRLGSGAGLAIVDAALKLLGAPYRNGGVDPAGFDCSGFTQYVFAEEGLALPREVRDQFRAGSPIDPAAGLLAGDLLFFTTEAPGASHVAISLGGDAFVHAPSSNGVVRVERLTTRYWAERYLGARRLTPP